MILTRPHLSALFAALLFVFSSPALTLAQQPVGEAGPAAEVSPPPSTASTIPLTRTYSPVALGTIGVLFPTSAVITVFGGRLFEAPVPAMGAPTPGSLDYRVAENFHGDLESGAPFLGGIPDYGGYALSALPVLYYGLGAGWTGLTGQKLYPWQGPYHLHSTMAYLESFTWTALLTNAAKFFVGRARPYVALERRAYGWHGGEDYLSFFSGHSSLSFAAATFLARDISDGLYHRVLVDAEPTERFLLGRALPYTLLYGAATTVAVSRLYDQKHFLSDVVVGAAVGTLISTLVYNTRFDARGVPHTRRGLALDVAPSPTPEPAQARASSSIDDGRGVAADQRLDLVIP
ncbi:phosphatase PAP2 family protein [Lujinxingia vulgaris]|uniref:Phosphatase PAP2 family protein n=1 Tax=Lujinxingia vulgaris TaxID=2600176 RepID=A0A5C6WXL0_9DELT|nr:phosphatase PAP2 family protein [Lujinxingia vulgaris]TXD31704.1 phosphatase PAP2 family protein [Lujinxingia vulgaris]